eukprot:TRINITY_DN2321_c0_g1_i1.p1 TRINITY_DN2321_c0_g1~~TRINITY_DN2321_c0_g1_i1.p1  ORF type:complete len:458 (-),score=73.80 TRINITY_DN2321_c0_g1_i1:99-1472(-)
MDTSLPSLAADVAVLAITFVIYFALGYYYFLRFLFRDYDPPYLPAVLFSTAFTLSCTLFELIIFEIVGLLTTTTRFWAWKSCLFLILTLLLVIYPFALTMTFFSSYRNLSWPINLVLSSICTGVFLLLFFRLGDPFPVLQKQAGVLSIAMGISRVGIVGVTLMAILSGVGAVEFPLNSMTYFMRVVEPSEIRRVEKLILNSCEQLLLKKKRLLLMIQKAKKAALEGSPDHGRDSSHSYLRKFLTGGSQSERERLEEDVRNQEQFNRELFSQLNHLRYDQFRDSESKKLKGRFFNLLGVFFIGYLIYKLFMSSINIIFDRVARTDPITRGFEIAFDWFGIDWLDVQFWSQYISFFLVGIMLVASVRGFLKRIMEVFIEYSSAVTSSLLAIFMGQIMGMYFVASILLMRMNLPLEYRAIITQVLPDIRFDFYHRWFDFIFIPSALVSLFLFFVVFGKRQ